MGPLGTGTGSSPVMSFPVQFSSTIQFIRDSNDGMTVGQWRGNLNNNPLSGDADSTILTIIRWQISLSIIMYMYVYNVITFLCS